jgi:Fic family protein
MNDITHYSRIETERFGPFVFQIGTDMQALTGLPERVEDAFEFFQSSPLARVASLFEKEVLVSSIHGTDTIEGGILSEQETAAVLDADPDKLHAEEARRVANMKRAYDLAQQAAANPEWRLSLQFIRDMHAAVTEGLTSVDARNTPGAWRENGDGIVTRVGTDATGGAYKPPQHGRDIALLMRELVEWHNAMQQAGVPALIRAPLVHLYFEWIHPFWDGNGRVGRALEATLLLAAGYRYAPLALAKYYLEHIQRYFTLFNTCRQRAVKGETAPHAEFIRFHLEGLLGTVKHLHRRVNALIRVLLFKARIQQLRDDKTLNARQCALMNALPVSGLSPDALRREPWYLALYLGKSTQTQRRDLLKLQEMQLITLTPDGHLFPGFVAEN